MKENYLIVVDMQNDFIDGDLGSGQAREALGKAVALAEDFEGKLIFTRDTHFEDYLETSEGKNLPVVHCIKDTPGWEISKPLDEIRLKRSSLVYEKYTFGSRKLAEDMLSLYEAGKVGEIHLCGVCTDICVVSNALLIKAAIPEAPIFVHRDCCAGVTPEKHDAALEVMASCQIAVV
ncbi:MAG: cysteine hydrolase [Eubacteriaceae bacterium]|nr:cysteine hydrolase [Eubacteriaceae bacterium]